MLSGYQTEEELIQNMVDAGCEEETVASVLTCLKQGQKKKGLLMLQRQRKISAVAHSAAVTAEACSLIPLLTGEK